MPITAEHVGRRYPSGAPYVVSQAKIAEFAAALGDSQPAFAGPDAIAPPTFGIVVASAAWQQLFDDPDLGLALERIVHADQGFDLVRPLRVGDEITATLAVTSVRSRGTTDWIGTAIELTTAEQEVVATMTATFVHARPAEATA